MDLVGMLGLTVDETVLPQRGVPYPFTCSAEIALRIVKQQLCVHWQSLANGRPAWLDHEALVVLADVTEPNVLDDPAHGRACHGVSWQKIHVGRRRELNQHE